MMKNKQIFLAAGLIALAAVARVLSAEYHWYNFAPVVAIGLVSTVILKDKRLAIAIALLGQFAADVYFQLFPMPGFAGMGFYGVAQFFTYAGLIAAAAFGTYMKNPTVLRIAGYTIGASAIFFLLSNLGYFVQGWNGYSISGLVKTYVDAIPFYRNSFAGDLTGSAVLFGAYFLYKKVAATRLQVA